MISFRNIIIATLTSAIMLFSQWTVAEEAEYEENEPNIFCSKTQCGPKKGLFQGANFGFSWTPELGDGGMELTELKLGAKFGLPAPNIKPFTKSFFMVSPNFSYTNVNWKGSEFFPESLYSAGVALTWMKPVNERWSLMFNVMPGYSGDGKASQDTVRFPVMFGATWTPNTKWKVQLGAMYTDRSDIPFMPFAGAVYTPNEDWRFELMAPQAKITRRWHGMSNARSERWSYLGFGFGGGSWAFESIGQQDDLAMLREYSLVLGCESISKTSSLKWNLEVAWLFGREMEFDRHTQPDQKLDDSLLLRLRCSF